MIGQNELIPPSYFSNNMKGGIVLTIFIAEHLLEILFGLISAGCLAFCKHIHNKNKQYKAMIEDKKTEDIEHKIDEKIEPIYEELQSVRNYIDNAKEIEKAHLVLIIDSYKFRLCQLCKEFLKQGYMTQAQYEQLSEFYRVYEGLGGNGQAKDYYNKACALPVKG